MEQKTALPLMARAMRRKSMMRQRQPHQYSMPDNNDTSMH